MGKIDFILVYLSVDKYNYFSGGMHLRRLQIRLRSNIEGKGGSHATESAC